MAGYLLRITVSGLLVAIVQRLLGSKGMIASAVKLITGVFMLFTVLSPLTDIRMDELQSIGNLGVNGEQAAAIGEADARNAMTEIITEQVRAYILDKAKALNVQIEVTVFCDDSMPPVPCGAEVHGRISPYAKNVLAEYMETELGIPKGAQKWTE